MAEGKTDIEDLLAQLRRCHAEGLRPGLAVGAFGLIHAGTIRFLRRAREDCDRLFALISPMADPAGGTGKAPELLRADERRRILAMMEEVDGVVLLERPEDFDAEAWRRAAPRARWARAGAEADVDPAVREKLKGQGVDLEALADSEDCTTRGLLERLAR